jgi:hypothetical protein
LFTNSSAKALSLWAFADDWNEGTNIIAKNAATRSKNLFFIAIKN